MTPFLPDEVEVLRSLARDWPDANGVVLGAAAIRCFLPMSSRVTEDLDFTVATGIEAAAATLARIPGWSPDPRDRRSVSDFLDTAEHADRGPRLVARMSILGPPSWRDPDAVIERIRAFRRGLGER